MSDLKKIDIRNAVRNGYKKIAIGNVKKVDSYGNALALKNSATEISRKIGYSNEEISMVPRELIWVLVVEIPN